MKNIHVLKTSKPSKLLKDLVDKTYQFKKEATFGNRIELPLNIYITSDEEIKEGDWCIDDEGIVKCTAHAGAMNHYYTKIILTTDQDLIKDGVQAIDDEFLEWFVKNPTFEFVEIDEYPRFDLGKGMYKIIIPKEETKQETLSWDELVQEAENKEELIKILKLPHIAPLVREAMRNNCKK
jgi:hypothetical protein